MNAFVKNLSSDSVERYALFQSCTSVLYSFDASGLGPVLLMFSDNVCRSSRDSMVGYPVT